MYPLIQRGVRFGQLAGALALAGVALTIPLPAAAKNDAASDNTPDNTTPAQNNDPSASAQPAFTDNRFGGALPGQMAQPNRPPSQRLPEPKSSDYGYSNFNAPSDAELDLFAATHRPPPGNKNRNRAPNGSPQPHTSDADASVEPGPPTKDASTNANATNEDAASKSSN